jgi:hypothetical protein
MRHAVFTHIYNSNPYGGARLIDALKNVVLISVYAQGGRHLGVEGDVAAAFCQTVEGETHRRQAVVEAQLHGFITVALHAY